MYLLHWPFPHPHNLCHKLIYIYIYDAKSCWCYGIFGGVVGGGKCGFGNGEATMVPNISNEDWGQLA
jgi:hypothetical protein